MRKNYPLFCLLLALLAACAPADTIGEAPAIAMTPSVEPEDPVVPTAESVTPPAPTAMPTPVRAALPDLGPAPAWDNTQWINSEALSLAELRGKVVLLEFWTFG